MQCRYLRPYVTPLFMVELTNYLCGFFKLKIKMPVNLCGFKMPPLIKREEVVAMGNLLSAGGLPAAAPCIPAYPSLAGRTPHLPLTPAGRLGV